MKSLRQTLITCNYKTEKQTRKVELKIHKRNFSYPFRSAKCPKTTVAVKDGFVLVISG